MEEEAQRRAEAETQEVSTAAASNDMEVTGMPSDVEAAAKLVMTPPRGIPPGAAAAASTVSADTHTKQDEKAPAEQAEEEEAPASGKKKKRRKKKASDGASVSASVQREEPKPKGKEKDKAAEDKQQQENPTEEAQTGHTRYADTKARPDYIVLYSTM